MTTKDHNSDEYYDDVEVAELLGISVVRLRNKVSAACPLPPRIQPPGCRRRLWPRQDVHDWLSRYLVTSTDFPDRPARRRRRA